MLRTLLLSLSENEMVAQWVMRNGLSRRVARRFVAGEALDDAIAAARGENQAARSVSLDLLGENVTNLEGARKAGDAYLSMFDRIAAEKLAANVSLKLTQLGIDLDEAHCESLVLSIAARAAQHGNFARIDMEGSAYTQRTVDICKRVHARYSAVGTVVQSYLYRSERDAKDLIAAGCPIRLVKGAYRELPEIAYSKKEDVDANYVRLMKLLLTSGINHAIATHDPHLIHATKAFAASQGIGKDKFEFQMLYGIRTDLQERLVREGYAMRVYIPFGVDWFPYFMRRLAERPANLAFFLKQLFR